MTQCVEPLGNFCRLAGLKNILYNRYILNHRHRADVGITKRWINRRRDDFRSHRKSWKRTGIVEGFVVAKSQGWSSLADRTGIGQGIALSLSWQSSREGRHTHRNQAITIHTDYNGTPLQLPELEVVNSLPPSLVCGRRRPKINGNAKGKPRDPSGQNSMTSLAMCNAPWLHILSEIVNDFILTLQTFIPININNPAAYCRAV